LFIYSAPVSLRFTFACRPALPSLLRCDRLFAALASLQLVSLRFTFACRPALPGSLRGDRLFAALASLQLNLPAGIFKFVLLQLGFASAFIIT